MIPPARGPLELRDRLKPAGFATVRALRVFHRCACDRDTTRLALVARKA